MANKVAKIVEQKTNKAVKVEFIREPDRPLDIPELWGDPTKAKTILGWKPQHNLETGLERAINEWAWILGLKYG
jgi:nucleoside-diphosphate-sugar epimerase